MVVGFIGCTKVPDKLYHPICSLTMDCSEKQLDKVISYRNNIYINPTGWGTCIRDKNHFSTSKNLNLDNHTYCKENQIEDKLQTPYYQAWLEFNETGEHHDENQIKAILRWIKAHKKNPLTIIVYIHGWHNNADNSNNDPRNNAVKFPFLMARVVDNTERLASYNQIEKQQVLGIYVGWRGKACKSDVLDLLTIYGRSEIANKIGQRGIIKKDFQRIAKEMGNKGHIMVIGHSLGGKILTSAFKSDLEHKRINQNSEFNTTAPLGKNGLIVTLNPAVHADCYENIFKYQSNNLYNYNNPITSRPYWVNVTSKNDNSTKEIYKWATLIHLVKGCKEQDYWREDTIGHYKPYLYQVIEVDGTILDTTKNNISHRYEMDWFLHPNPSKILIFPNRLYPNKKSKIVRVRFSLNGKDNEHIPPNALKRKVWNVRTDGTLIDFGDEGGGGLVGHHSGYISTILTRLLIEMLFYKQKNS